MTNEEILEKAIQKAIDGGYKHWTSAETNREETVRGVLFVHSDDCGILNTEELIFNHDFAKALWGELPKRSADMYDCPQDEIGQVDTDNWEHHLQQMVISEDPIKYLGDNI